MQRSELEVYLPTNLPTNQPNGAKLSIATLSNKADPSLPCGTIVAWESVPAQPSSRRLFHCFAVPYMRESGCSRTVTQFRYLMYERWQKKKRTRNLEFSAPTYRMSLNSRHSTRNTTSRCKFALNHNQTLTYVTAALLELMYLTGPSVMLKSNRGVFAGEKSIERVRCYRIPCVPYV